MLQSPRAAVIFAEWILSKFRISVCFAIPLPIKPAYFVLHLHISSWEWKINFYIMIAVCAHNLLREIKKNNWRRILDMATAVCPQHSDYLIDNKKKNYSATSVSRWDTKFVSERKRMLTLKKIRKFAYLDTTQRNMIGRLMNAHYTVLSAERTVLLWAISYHVLFNFWFIISD